MIKPGMIGFAGKRSGFYPNAVRFFTKSRWSHCFVGMEKYFDEPAVIEADLKVQIVSFVSEYVEKDNDYYEIWEPILASQSSIMHALDYIYKTDAGATYGFLQIPWFAVRSMLGKLGIRLKKNWSTDGQICSETLYKFLVRLGDKYRNAFGHLTENECSPEDLYAVVVSRKDLFRFVMEKK